MNRLNIKRSILLSCACMMTFTAAFAQEDEKVVSGAWLESNSATTTSAVSTVSGDELYNTPTPSLSNTMGGLLSGLTAIQGTGEVNNDAASLIIRGVGSYGYGGFNKAKIFVDGFEVNGTYFNSMSPSEIESVSILKDGAALALLGERGGNGAIWVVTKRGKVGPSTITAKVRSGVQLPTVLNKPLGSYDYANLYNQAVSNDNGMKWSPVYDQAQLDAYKNGTGVDVDWYDEALRKNGMYTDADVIMNGGTENARYNVNLGYINQQGLLNTKNTDQTKNLSYQRINLRANLDFDILDIFEAKMDLGGRLEFNYRPNYGVGSLMNDLARYPSNIYNVFDDEAKTNYSGTQVYNNNPYASVNALGWTSTKVRMLQGNFSLKEKFDFLLEGLYLKEAFSFNTRTVSAYSKTRNYARWFNGATTTTDLTTSITASGYGSNGMEDWKQGLITLGYDNQFGKHSVSAAANYYISAFKGDGYFSYKYNTMNVNAYANYNYDNRYVAEVAFSYYGNDAYAPQNRWAFYPSVSAAWVISNEDWLKGNDAVQLLKLRASFGQSGVSDSSASISDYASNGRFLFKDYYGYSQVGSFYTGKDSGTWQATLAPMFMPNPDARAERSTKYNLGLDAELLENRLAFTADVYLDKRTDVLTLDNTLMAYYGRNTYLSNIGSMTNKGFELSAAWSDKAGDFKYSINGMVSFNRNRIDFMSEETPANAFSAKTGRPYGTYIGLVADGFYNVDDFDGNNNLKSNLPTPAFGSVQPGDIKYKDLDNNGVIDQNDVDQIGKSAYPEWTFSLGAKFEYKGFDFSFMFQGNAGASMNLLDNWNQFVSFVDNGNVYPMAKDAWAYYPMQGIDNRDTAKWPRLTTVGNTHNYQTSSLWIKDRNYIKLRNVELGYNFANTVLKQSGVSNLRIYVSGSNLLTISSLKKEFGIDPESIYGGYPALKSVTAGLVLTF